MNDINENKVPEEVRLKIEKLEKNVEEYNVNALGASITAGSILLGIIIMSRGEYMTDFTETLAYLFMGGFSVTEGWLIKKIADFVSKRNIAEDKIATLEEEYNIPSAKKRTRGR